MSKIVLIATILNVALLILLLAAVVGFISFMNLYGVFLALVTTFIAWGIYKNKRWSYFSAAAWGLACYQLAKEGYEFQTIKHQVMTLGVLMIPVAIFLHEILAKQSDSPAQKSVTKTSDDREMPQ